MNNRMVAEELWKRLTGQSLSIDDDIKQLPDIVTWAEANFYVGKGKTIELQPVQKSVLREMFRQGDDGQFVYRDGLYSTIKKSGKTTIAAVVMQWACETWGEYKEIYHLGNKLKQAQGRAFKLVRQSIEWGGRTSEWDMTATQLIFKANRSFIQALPINAAGEAGGHQCLTTWTEAHGIAHEANKRMWEEMQPIPTEPLSFRFIESYAGYKGESEVLEAVWDRAKEGGRVHDEYPIYTNGRLIGYVDEGVEARRMPWQTPAYYIEAEESSLPHEFARIHLNQWVSTQSTFVPDVMWDRLVHHLDIVPGVTDVVLGVDASVSGDCSAVVAVGMIDDLPTELETVVFTPPKGGTLDYSQTIEPTIRAMMAKWRVIGVAYDPYQLHDMMTRLSKEYAPYDVQIKAEDRLFYAFNQQGERLKSDTDLLTRIRQGNFQHMGNTTLKQHVQNADQKIISDSAIRIIKRKDNHPIDALVAVSMACWRIVHIKQFAISTDYDSDAADLLNDFRG